MNNSTIGNKRYKTSDCYIKKPTEMVEMKLNKITFKKPHLMKALEKSTDHPSLGKNTKNPFKTQ